jgi:hypothetical protein
MRTFRPQSRSGGLRPIQAKKMQAVRLYCKETGTDIKAAAAVVAALEHDLDQSRSG